MLSAPGLEELLGHVVRFHKRLDELSHGTQDAGVGARGGGGRCSSSSERGIARGAGGRRNERDPSATRRRECGRHDALELLQQLLEVQLHQRAALVRTAAHI